MYQSTVPYLAQREGFALEFYKLFRILVKDIICKILRPPPKTIINRFFTAGFGIPWYKKRNLSQTARVRLRLLLAPHQGKCTNLCEEIRQRLSAFLCHLRFRVCVFAVR